MLFRRRSPFVRVLVAASIVSTTQACFFRTSNPPGPDTGDTDVVDTDTDVSDTDTDASDTDTDVSETDTDVSETDTDAPDTDAPDTDPDTDATEG
jgi:hypothetical protein